MSIPAGNVRELDTRSSEVFFWLPGRGASAIWDCGPLLWCWRRLEEMSLDDVEHHLIQRRWPPDGNVSQAARLWA